MNRRAHWHISKVDTGGTARQGTLACQAITRSADGTTPISFLIFIPDLWAWCPVFHRQKSTPETMAFTSWPTKRFTVRTRVTRIPHCKVSPVFSESHGHHPIGTLLRLGSTADWCIKDSFPAGIGIHSASLLPTWR